MPQPTARACTQCDSPLPSNKTKLCGKPECARAQKIQQQRAYHQRYRDKHGVSFNARRRRDPAKLKSDRAYHRGRVSAPCTACGAPVPRRRASTREQHRAACRNQMCRGYLARGRWAASPIPASHPSRSTRVPVDHPARRRRPTWTLTGPRFIAGFCRYCDTSFTIDRLRIFGAEADWSYCSLRCTRRAGKTRRRVKAKQAQHEPVVPTRVYRRDRWTCQVCNRKVARDQQVPHPQAPTLDHIVPINEHGDHTYANLRTAHFLCNSRRGNRGGGEQLALIG